MTFGKLANILRLEHNVSTYTPFFLSISQFFFTGKDQSMSTIRVYYYKRSNKLETFDTDT